MGPQLAEALVRIFIVLLILVPYFAFVSLGEALGKGNLAKAFFVDRGELSYLAKIQDNASRAR
jgi:5-formyltetrahydrofolate cyclo-ligase